MTLTREEINNLEEAIMSAVKQAPIIMLYAISSEKQGTPAMLTIKEILEANIVYAEALKTINKLKQGETYEK